MELDTAFDQHQTAVNADPADVTEARRRPKRASSAEPARRRAAGAQGLGPPVPPEFFDDHR